MSNFVATSTTASEQLRSKASEVKENLREMGALAPEAAREKFSELRESASECCAHARERATEGLIRGHYFL